MAQVETSIGPGFRGSTPFDLLVAGGILTLFGVFAITIVVALYVLIERHERAEALDALVSTAKISTQNISSFRAFYSGEILSNIDKTKVPVTHEFRDVEGALPLPATMSIELGAYLEQQDAHMGYRMYSSQPFPWRETRVLDAFEGEALSAIEADPGRPIYEIEDMDGVDVFRYVSAVRMEESCIACHNSHPESPATNWSIGDVRGVQEILIPLTQNDTPLHFGATFRDIIVFVVLSFTLAGVFILVLARRNRAAFGELKTLASIERQRAVTLEEAQGRIQESLGRLNAVMDNVADAIVTIDEAGLIESANPATEQIFGYSKDALIGKNIALLMPEDVQGQHVSFIANYLETGSSGIIGVGRELEGRRIDGSHFPLELSIGEVPLGDRILFTGVMRDITHRKKVEQELRESERKSRTLSLVADRTDNAVIITDANGSIEWINEGFERISGYSLAEVTGRKPGDFLQGPMTDPSVVSDIRKRLQSGESFHAELINYTKEGKSYWVQIDAQPIVGPDGKIEHYIAIERDVTVAKQREEELEDARHKAEEGNEAKSRFLAMMSHEIRTPLNGVLGALGLLEEGELPERDLELVRVGKKAGENLMVIINDVLDVSKMDTDLFALEDSVLEPRLLVEDVNDILRVKAEEKGIALETVIDPALPEFLMGDDARIRQILINLVGNAIKFTNEGYVRISVRVSRQDALGLQLRVDVEDTGSGISDANRRHLFDEFWRSADTKTRVIEGTGLGLAICQKLVQLMGGAIQVESQLDLGSTFSFTIPMVLPTDEEIQVYHGSAVDLLPARVDDVRFENRILVAEDSSANQMIIRMMLERLGAHVDLVGDGREAVEAVQSLPYDLVLMDINMPTMDGVAATRAIRNLPDVSPDLPIISMTAYAMQGDREALLNEGLSDYIAKPIKRSELTAVLSRWLLKEDLISATPFVEQVEPEPKGQDDIPLFDPSALDDLLGWAGPDGGRHVVNVFAQEFEERFEAMGSMIAEGDVDSANREAHTIKGAAAGVGAIRLSSRFKLLEHEKRIHVFQDEMKEIKTLFLKSMTACRRHLDTVLPV